MARPLRVSLPSYLHHVIQRGNNRQPIFLAPNDYEVFLECLREALSGELAEADDACRRLAAITGKTEEALPCVRGVEPGHVPRSAE